MSRNAELQACFREISEWEQRALARYCTRWWKKSAVKDPDLYIMAWNPGREQTLRERYPYAEFLDVGYEKFTQF